ncbi:MAG TPA: hypothetical protein VE170_08115 [Candidatus Limnocylindria bacterium]|nr:hypothetical protein [Candidatus Limnocylindria bacterium]
MEFFAAWAWVIVRSMDPEWLREVYSFALKPDAIFVCGSTSTTW